jgi:hypothetical protein
MDEATAKAMTKGEWAMYVTTRIRNRAPGVRIGQEYFNALYEIRPMIARGLTASTFDPFFHDYVSAECLAYVSRNWEWANA